MTAHTELEAGVEFSRPLGVAELENGEITLEIAADDTELAGLQRRFGVDAVRSASAKLVIAPQSEGVVKVSGVVCANLSQICIVTLEPVEEKVEDAISVSYLPPGVEEPQASPESDLQTQEEFEPFDGLSIDLGELAAQQIAAAINPYPRKAGVEFGNQGQLGDNDPEERDNPFAVLKALKGEDGQEQDQ